MALKTAYHYNFAALDRLLADTYDSREIGNGLDQIMSELVKHGRQDEDHHYLLRRSPFGLKRLRDIFWNLPEHPQK